MDRAFGSVTDLLDDSTEELIRETSLAATLYEMPGVNIIYTVIIVVTNCHCKLHLSTLNLMHVEVWLCCEHVVGRR